MVAATFRSTAARPIFIQLFCRGSSCGGIPSAPIGLLFGLSPILHVDHVVVLHRLICFLKQGLVRPADRDVPSHVPDVPDILVGSNTSRLPTLLVSTTCAWWFPQLHPLAPVYQLKQPWVCSTGLPCLALYGAPCSQSHGGCAEHKPCSHRRLIRSKLVMRHHHLPGSVASQNSRTNNIAHVLVYMYLPPLVSSPLVFLLLSSTE